MQDTPMQPLGDTALLVQSAGGEASAWVAALESDLLTGVTDVVAAFGTLGVFFDPTRVVAGGGSPIAAVADWVSARIAAAETVAPPPRREHVIPVVYGGQHGSDLDEVARRAGVESEEVIELHQSASYEVGAIGFTPGFAFLTGLREQLHTPRRATPRTSVPAGSVAIGGHYTGVYPLASPGGWNLIGRTSTNLFSLRRDPPSLLRAGDSVRFLQASLEDLERCDESQPSAPLVRSRSSPSLQILSPGALTTLQDLGRAGHRSIGVSASGALDASSLRLANVLAGNDQSCAAIEAALVGPQLLCLEDTVVGLAGAAPQVLGGARRLSLQAGEQLDLRQIAGGGVAYLAIAGGLEADTVLGAAGTDLLAGFGGRAGRPLKKGDLLTRSHPPSGAASSEASPHWSVASPSLAGVRSGEARLRVLRGPQARSLGDDAWRRLLADEFRVAKESNRMGLRLDGPELGSDSGHRTSQPVAPGAIQVPPGGKPIILGTDCQTLGGYPVIACVASADLPAMGQLRPGDMVRFEEVTLDEAEDLRRDAEADLQKIFAGIAARDA